MQQDSPDLLNDRQKELPDLFERSVKAGGWVIGGRIVRELLILIRIVVLARLLDKSDFGLLGIALLVSHVLTTFTSTGFSAALIQKKGHIAGYLDTVWTIGIIRGFLLFAAIYFAAPYGAAFFETAEAEPVIRVIGLGVLLGSFSNIGIVYFKKELDFHKHFIYDISGSVGGMIVAVCIAVIYRSVWALVLGRIVGSAIRCCMGYLLHPYRPKLSLDLKKAAELWRFGRHVLGTAVLKLFILQGDDAFLGKMLGAATLGLYQMAYRISSMAATEVANVIGQVTFPAYSKIQDDKSRLSDGFIKTCQLTVGLTFPITGGIFVLAPEIISVILGEKWMPMVPAMRVLCVLGMFKTIQSGSLFKAIGRPDIVTKTSLVRLAIIAAGIYPLTMRFGMLGTAWSVLLPAFIIKPCHLFVLKKHVNYDVAGLCRALFFPLIATLTMMLLVYAAKFFVGQ
ncbi:MAG: lipopolysaccharide biosynthesis protein, partial [Planctomycetes bacterium]|nr:lipopolysaccharide biosynthesis protein [Planctomycetota bacterium]